MKLETCQMKKARFKVEKVHFSSIWRIMIKYTHACILTHANTHTHLQTHTYT